MCTTVTNVTFELPDIVGLMLKSGLNIFRLTRRPTESVDPIFYPARWLPT